jgi:hypothetical protein
MLLSSGIVTFCAYLQMSLHVYVYITYCGI